MTHLALCVPRAHRPTHAHWALNPPAADAAGVDIISVHKPQQWETPWEVFDYARGRWPIDFDACASPLSALAPRYASAADDFLARCDLYGRTIFCNPPYSVDRSATGSCAAIGPIVQKLVEGDVAVRGCTAIALLPVLSHQHWFHMHVTGALGGGRVCHEIYWISPLLKWNNPFQEEPPRSPYLYPFVLCVWHPGPPPSHPVSSHVTLSTPDRNHHSHQLHLRRCQQCAKVRVLPRYLDPACVPVHHFNCGNVEGGACSDHEYVMHFT